MSLRRRRRTRYSRTRRTNRRRTFGRALGKRQKGFVRTQGYYGRHASISNPLAFQRNSSKELKFLDTKQELADVIAGAAGIQDSLNKVQQNTTENGRIGRNIVIKKIMFKGQLHLKQQTDVALSHDIVRIIVYLDKQTNGAQADESDVLQTISSINGERAIDSFRKLSSAKRFVILMDKKWVFNSGSAVSSTTDTISTSRVVRIVHWFINTNIPIEFSGTLGNIGEIKTNNIGIIIVGLDGRCEIEGTYRIRYYG